MPRRKILRDGNQNENENSESYKDNDNEKDNRNNKEEKSLAREIYGDAKEGVKDVVKNVKVFASDNSEYLREFGLTMVYIKASGIIFFSLIIFVIGLIALLNPKQKMTEAEGIVSDSECKPSGDKNATNNCNFKVKFKDAENKEYTVFINTNTTKTYSSNDNIKVYYDPKNPSDASIETDYIYSYIIYILMIIFGVVGFISAIVWIFISRKYSFLAQAEGLDVAAGKIRDIFS
jgi:hypothetical protein